MRNRTAGTEGGEKKGKGVPGSKLTFFPPQGDSVTLRRSAGMAIIGGEVKNFLLNEREET